MLCPRSDHNEAALRDAVDGMGLALLHDWVVGAAAEVRATTTSSTNMNKICVSEEFRNTSAAIVITDVSR